MDPSTQDDAGSHFAYVYENEVMLSFVLRRNSVRLGRQVRVVLNDDRQLTILLSMAQRNGTPLLEC